VFWWFLKHWVQPKTGEFWGHVPRCLNLDNPSCCIDNCFVLDILATIILTLCHYNPTHSMTYRDYKVSQ